MRELTGMFKATGDDGHLYTVCIYTVANEEAKWTNCTPGEGTSIVLVTSQGLPVKRLQLGEYQIADTGVVLRANKSDAI